MTSGLLKKMNIFKSGLLKKMNIFKKKFYWSKKILLIYNVNFCCTAKWFSYTYNVFRILFHYITEHWIQLPVLYSEWAKLLLCLTLCDPVDYSLPGFSIHGSPGKSTGVGYHFLLQGSSWPRDRTWVSRIGGRCFNLWATREARAIQ